MLLDPLPSATFVLCKANTSSDPHTGWKQDGNRMESSEPCRTSGMPDVSFLTPPCRRWFYTESQPSCCSNAVGMTLILPASDLTRFVRLSQVAQVRKKRGASHQTIITTHLQGKFSSNLRKRKMGSQQVFLTTPCHATSFHQWSVAYHSRDGLQPPVRSWGVQRLTSLTVKICVNFRLAMQGFAGIALHQLPCSCWTRLLQR
jgi:hypothetical protein